MPSFVVRVHGFSEDRAGLLIGVIGVLTGVAGVLSGGFLADWLLRRTPGGRLLTVGISLVAGFPLVLAAIFVPYRTISMILAALAMYLFTFYFSCTGPLIHQVARPNLRATAFAFYTFVIHILGSAIACGPAVREETLEGANGFSRVHLGPGIAGCRESQGK